MTIEKKTAGAILQQPTKVKIGGKEYVVAKPTVGTIIMLSGLISELPSFEKGATVADILAEARHATVLGRIVATLVLGAKEVQRREKETRRKSIWNLFGRKTESVEDIASVALSELSPMEMSNIVSDGISTLQIGAFFALTTSLMRANILKRTKSEVEN